MYTFTIESIHNKNTDSDKKIVGGGKKFNVYKVSDFILIDVEDLIMEQLCKYFFGYVVYDKLVDDDGKKMYYELQKKLGKLEESIIKKLYNGVDEGKDTVLRLVSSSGNDINQFSEYISSLFSVTSADSAGKSVDITRANWEDVSSKINLSQGQYLHHLDNVYKKYESIYHNEIDDHKLKKILDIVDTSVRLGFLQGHSYSYHQKVELKYTQLESIKSSNFFYKTEHFYIQDDQLLTKTFAKPENIEKLLKSHGIEKLIHIYYTYISFRDLRRLYEFRIHLRKAIANFMCYNNINIVNLLIFQDILFYKIIKNGASIIYNKEGSADPVSKPLLKDTLTVEDKASADNINEPFLKHQLFYRYKELEKVLRRYYLPRVYFGLDGSRNKQHEAVDIIHTRQTTLEDDVCLLDTEGEIIIDKMKSVTTFYKPEPETPETPYQPCQLVKYIYIDGELSSEGSMETYCIGKISTVKYQDKHCDIEFITIIKDKDTFENFDNTIDELSFKSNDTHTKGDIHAEFNDLFKSSREITGIQTDLQTTFNLPTISFDNIYDTSLSFGKLLENKCDYNKNFKIRYRDFDLFNSQHDRDVTFSPLVYTIPFEDDPNPYVLFIIPESVQSFRPEAKPLGSGQEEENDKQYAYITFDIDNTNNTLTKISCNTITECEIDKLFKENTTLSETYNDKCTHCILIEEINGDTYIKRAWGEIERLDKLYFSESEINLQ
jgi:hypothetical protein